MRYRLIIQELKKSTDQNVRAFINDVEGMKNAILYCIEHREALNRASREYVRRFENSDVATQISNVYISL